MEVRKDTIINFNDLIKVIANANLINFNGIRIKFAKPNFYYETTYVPSKDSTSDQRLKIIDEQPAILSNLDQVVIQSIIFSSDNYIEIALYLVTDKDKKIEFNTDKYTNPTPEVK